jgi:hypothetical protein
LHLLVNEAARNFHAFRRHADLIIQKRTKIHYCKRGQIKAPHIQRVVSEKLNRQQVVLVQWS